MNDTSDGSEAILDVTAETAAAALPETERVIRGLALSVLVVPAGVLLWVLIWNVGFIASIVSYGVAFGAVWLYRFGSKARVTRAAFWAIVGIIVVTLVLSLLAGMYSDVVRATGFPLTQALTDSRVWDFYWRSIFTNGEVWASYLPQILLAVAFAALGCFRTIRRLAAESRR